MLNKEFEALEFLKQQAIAFEHSELAIKVANENHTIVEQALTELKAIKEANPSEAMKCIEDLIFNFSVDEYVDRYDKNLATIKNYILKVQEQDKVLEIIKEKCLYTDNLNEVATCLNYNYYKERMSKKYDTKVVKTDWNDKVLLDCLKLLTEEEFDTLKRWSEKCH